MNTGWDIAWRVYIAPVIHVSQISNFFLIIFQQYHHKSKVSWMLWIHVISPWIVTEHSVYSVSWKTLTDTARGVPRRSPRCLLIQSNWQSNFNHLSFCTLYLFLWIRNWITNLYLEIFLDKIQINQVIRKVVRKLSNNQFSKFWYKKYFEIR